MSKHARSHEPGDDREIKPFDLDAPLPMMRRFRAGQGVTIMVIFILFTLLGTGTLAFRSYQFAHRTDARLNSLERESKQRVNRRNEELKEMRRQVHNSEERQRRIDCNILQKFPAPPGSGVARARAELKCGSLPPEPSSTPSPTRKPHG